ncbi:ABC transporter substrate-binding protein [Deinococcus detaillensis]|uniref:ABC transporter substrate-binding protein n=1 Tax=Deinococcus detaillensis TaxID=2592048 RepID=A0A553V160_9DEIO|nr:ABC transporter substrate-binding protein [Deinococcus detaillensis]TSA86183.1 ABC transporter substrate-binding protein [Deinococcus detaillensis]
MHRTTHRLRSTLALALALSSPLAAAQSGRESTLVLGGDFSDLITLDPGVSYEFTGSLLAGNLYDTLVAYEGNNLTTLRPRLASSWKVAPTATGSRITFTLRDAKFSTGRPVTAADVVYSLNRVISLKTPSSFLLTDVANIKIGSVTAPDAKTLVMDIPKTANPNIVLALLTFNVGGVIDSAEAKAHEQNGDFGTAWLKDHSAGSGPFALNRWDRSAQVALDINPNAFRKSPNIKRVILRYMQESAVQQSALNSGEIDVAWDYTPDAFNAALKNSKLKALKTDTFQLQYLGMNSGKGAAFEDARVRQAVRYATDQDGIIKSLLQGLGRKTQTIIPIGLAGSNSALPYTYNVTKAKELMAAAGKSGGFSVDFSIPTGSCAGGVPCQDLAAKVQSDLAKIGIKANIKQMVSADLYTMYRAQKAELILAPWSPDYADADGNGTPLADFNAKSLAWRNVWQNDQASKLAQAAAIETDATKRVALYKQLTELVAKDGPYAILYQPYKPVVTSVNVVGFDRNANGDVRFEKVSKK